MRIILAVTLLIKFTLVQAAEEVLLHPRVIDAYERHKVDYERLGLTKDAKKEDVCVNYLASVKKDFEGMQLFDKFGFKYKDAILMSVSVEENGFCLTLVGLNEKKFGMWLENFISSNLSVPKESYRIEYKPAT